MRVMMMMIKADREPGHLPSQEFLAQMGKYNEELSKAGVLLERSFWRSFHQAQPARREATRQTG